MGEGLKVLVTGAAGFIGSHLTERLLNEGLRVYALDNFDNFYNPVIKRRNLANCLHHPSFTLIEADIRDNDRLNAVFELYSFDLIIHLAALAGVRPSIERPADYMDVNVTGTVNLLNLAARQGIGKFIFASSSSIYGNNQKIPFSENDVVDQPISPYAVSKRAGELLCHNWHYHYGMSIVCLRFFTVYGPRQRPDLAIHKFSRCITEGIDVSVFGDGSSSRDYTYIDDIIEGIVQTISYVTSKNIFEIINLGESETISLNAMINYLENLSGRTLKRVNLPLPAGDLPNTYADIAKARELLRYDPQTPFSVGINKWWEWFKSST